MEIKYEDAKRERDEWREHCELEASHAEAAERERDEARSALTALLGMDTAWPLCDVIRTLGYAASHLLDHHDCDCDGYESYVGALESSARYEVLARKGGA